MSKELEINKDWLYQKYIIEKLSTHKIAKEINTDHKTILRHLRKSNIEIRKNGLKNKDILFFKNKKWLEENYINKCFSTRELAKMIGVWQKTIINWLNEYQVPIRSYQESLVYKKSPSGENHHNWNNGITPLRKNIRETSKYYQWRFSIFKRDNFICIFCGISSKEKILNVDHIKPFSLILKENNINSIEDAINCQELWDISNGRTLCIDCHKSTDTYGEKAKKLIKKEN